MKSTFLLMLCGVAIGMSELAQATTVSSGGIGSNGTLTDLGSFSAGTYELKATGVVSLGPVPGEFVMNPDGSPSLPVTSPGYAYFNPNGSFIADGMFGAAGPNARIGALIGTLSATPETPSDWFLIGYSTTVVLSSPGHIFASVNDTYHQNNFGAFVVTVSAVPEVQTSLLSLAGFGVIVWAKTRNARRRTQIDT